MVKHLGRGLCLGGVLIFLLEGTAWSAPLDGPTLYAKECASCHGKDGRGAPEGTGLTVSLPDFTDCSSHSSASTSDWTDVITNGGAFTDLSDQMPSFGEVLSPEENSDRPRLCPQFLSGSRLAVRRPEFPQNPLYVQSVSGK